MPKALTTKEFIKRAKNVHGERYDYSKVSYNNNRTKIQILCDKHGLFKQTPNNHLSGGQGCPECGKEKRALNRRKTTEKFIEESKEIHGDKYSYGATNYIKQGIRVKIKCPKHGIFKQFPSNHLKGKDCKECGKEKRIKSIKRSTDEFIKDCENVHGNRYGYSLVKYNGSDKKVDIVCDEHGVFKQRPYNHLIGQGCPKCVSNYKDNTESFIEKAKDVHGDEYIYRDVNYINAHTKVKIECKEHGYFYQSSNNHLKGKGCPQCANENSSGNWRYSEWIEASKNSENFDSFKLYIIKCYDDNEEFYKVGRTFLKIKKRFKSCSIPYNYDVVSIINGDGRNICEFENILHNQNKDNKYLPKKKFKGMYECFNNINQLII